MRAGAGDQPSGNAAVQRPDNWVLPGNKGIGEALRGDAGAGEPLDRGSEENRKKSGANLQGAGEAGRSASDKARAAFILLCGSAYGLSLNELRLASNYSR